MAVSCGIVKSKLLYHLVPGHQFPHRPSPQQNLPLASVGSKALSFGNAQRQQQCHPGFVDRADRLFLQNVGQNFPVVNAPRAGGAPFHIAVFDKPTGSEGAAVATHLQGGSEIRIERGVGIENPQSDQDVVGG